MVKTFWAVRDMWGVGLYAKKPSSITSGAVPS